MKDVQDQANADQVAPVEDIDLDRAAQDAERRLSGEAPVGVTSVQDKTEEATEEVTESVTEESREEKEVEETAETVQEETPDGKEEPEDHKERTRLGRKVAKLEDNIGKLLEQNSLLIEKLLSKPTVEKKTDEVDEEYIDLSTPEGLDRFLSRREEMRIRAAENEKAKYAIGYSERVGEYTRKAAEEQDADAAEIIKLLTGDTPFNVRRSSDPSSDFDINMAKAEAHFYREKANKKDVKPEVPLKNEKARSPLGVGGDSRSDKSEISNKAVNISPEALAFAREQGWDDQVVASILSKPIPNSFVKGRR